MNQACYFLMVFEITVPICSLKDFESEKLGFNTIVPENFLFLDEGFVNLFHLSIQDIQYYWFVKKIR